MKFTEDSLFIAPTPVRLSEELAGWFFAQVSELSSREKPYCIAISGGNTPILFFNHLAAKYGNKINWQKLHFFWADERCVHPSHHESNYLSAYNNLLSKISIPQSNIHRMKGEGNPVEEANNYISDILSVVNIENDLPKFDLILLGMGDDGHIASLFPKQEIINSKKICDASLNPSTKQTRITLTPLCINNADKVVFQVTGMIKSNIVNEILLKHSGYTDYPAAHIKPKNGNLYWFLDAGAAKGMFT